MIVYKSNKESFSADVASGVMEEIIEEQYVATLKQRVSPNEKRSWQNSMVYMNLVLADRDIPEDAGITIEMQIPQTSKRIDFIISGRDHSLSDHAVIVELKQWESAEKTPMDGIVRTWLGNGIREVSHPSYQAWSYAALLRDFNEAVYDGDINLISCAYLHNYTPNGALEDPFYHEHLEKAPVFMKPDVLKLREFIKSFVKHGDSSDIILQIEQGRIRPSKMLADKLRSMLSGNEEFIMLDEQKVAYEYVMDRVLRTGEKKNVILVEGGPGTGKSVVAINLLVQLIQMQKMVSYVTKNSAPREVYAALLSGDMKKSHISNLFKGSGSFYDLPRDMFDALIVDEAHRLNAKSGMFRNNGENQIKEIIDAARVAVFFIDENQRIHIHDIGSKEQIRHWAHRAGAEIIETRLESQFRCNGSDGYLAWLDHTLQIRNTANTELSATEYDFKVCDSPNEVFERIEQRNRANNKSRMVAGYCWDWKSKRDPGAMDIVLQEHGFAKKWNLADDGMLWMIKPESVHEIGCIHTCQGLELEYVGVIIGPDLKVRNAEVITDVSRRSSNDRSVFGIKKMLNEQPQKAIMIAEEIIKNTYRTLMSRGMKGCYIYCTDAETREYFRSRLGT